MDERRPFRAPSTPSEESLPVRPEPQGAGSLSYLEIAQRARDSERAHRMALARREQLRRARLAATRPRPKPEPVVHRRYVCVSAEEPEARVAFLTFVRDTGVQVRPVSRQEREEFGVPDWMKHALESRDESLLRRAVTLPQNVPAWAHITVE